MKCRDFEVCVLINARGVCEKFYSIDIVIVTTDFSILFSMTRCELLSAVTENAVTLNNALDCRTNGLSD